MYRRDAKGWLKHLDFMVLDLLTLQLAYILSFWLRHGSWNPYARDLYGSMGMFIMLCDLVIIFFTEPFRNILKRGYFREAEAIIQQTLFIELFAMGFLFAQQTGGDFSRLTMLYLGITYPVFSYILRQMWKTVLKKTRREGHRSLLIVTTLENAGKVIRNIKGSNYGTYALTGLVIMDTDYPGDEIQGVPVVANAQTVSDYAQKHWVDEVFVDLPESVLFPQKLVDSFITMGVTVHLNLTRSSNIPGKIQLVEKVGTYNVLTTTMNYATTKQAMFKRCMDIAGGLVGCLICAVLFVFVAPAIYIASPGPIFFTQERIGKNGKRFKMYKFRSMYMDAEARKAELMKQNKMNGGLMFKLDFDPRIIGNKVLADGTRKTGIGQFIRSTSIDEFPQFFNVLKGDMSLVGTRPPLISEFDQYEPHHRARMSVKPGITGMWQVSGRSEITDFEEVVRLDTKYINEWSIGLDIKILFQTVIAVLRRKGSM
ncbi:MAG: sugar transferase [Oscillospiraceae bacterium]|nr:sugar transferase [Oscillospiraceae bacterium]